MLRLSRRVRSCAPPPERPVGVPLPNSARRLMHHQKGCDVACRGELSAGLLSLGRTAVCAPDVGGVLGRTLTRCKGGGWCRGWGNSLRGTRSAEVKGARFTLIRPRPLHQWSTALTVALPRGVSTCGGEAEAHTVAERATARPAHQTSSTVFTNFDTVTEFSPTHNHRDVPAFTPRAQFGSHHTLLAVQAPGRPDARSD